MKKEEIITEFSKFIGDEFFDFVEALGKSRLGPDRLLYWQEKRWSRFTDVHSELKSKTQKEIIALFEICQVHRVPLEEDTVSIIYGYFKLSEDFLNAQRHIFPNAHFMAYGPDWGGDKSREDVRYCQKCRDAMVAWSRKNNSKFGLPKEVIERL